MVAEVGCGMSLLLLLACASQSYEAGIRAACESPNDPRMRANPGLDTLSLVIDDTVTNAAARDLAFAMGQPDAGDATKRLKADARAAGLTHCALVEPAPSSTPKPAEAEELELPPPPPPPPID